MKDLGKDGHADFKTDLAGLTGEDWLDALEDLAEERGFFEPLGKLFSAAFIDAGPKLVVTFECLPDIFARSDTHDPRGFDLVRSQGWSNLTILSHEKGWFRGDKLYRYFDRLIDDGFFEGFDDVLFMGEYEGGYAAAAYSVASPGARVLAIRPVATLDPALAGWDTRDKRARRQSFNDRFGYAPDMIEAAQAGHIVFDPNEGIDAMHAALFRRPGVTLLPVRGLGDQGLATFDAINATDSLVALAMSGTLTRETLAPLWRARRDHLPYLRGLLTHLEKSDRRGLAAQLCRHVLKSRNRPFFARKLDALTGKSKPDETTPA